MVLNGFDFPVLGHGWGGMVQTLCVFCSTFVHAFCVCQGIHEYVARGQIVIPPMTSPTLFPLGGNAPQWAWANRGGGGGRRLLRAGGWGGGRRRPFKYHLKFRMCKNDHVEHHAF